MHSKKISNQLLFLFFFSVFISSNFQIQFDVFCCMNNIYYFNCFVVVEWCLWDTQKCKCILMCVCDCVWLRECQSAAHVYELWCTLNATIRSRNRAHDLSIESMHDQEINCHCGLYIMLCLIFPQSRRMRAVCMCMCALQKRKNKFFLKFWFLCGWEPKNFRSDIRSLDRAMT